MHLYVFTADYKEMFYYIHFFTLQVTECQPLKDEQIAGWFVFVLFYGITHKKNYSYTKQ